MSGPHALAAMLALASALPTDTVSAGHRHYGAKSPKSKKQRKARAKAKVARKTRKRQRRG